MFLLVLARSGCPGQNPESHKMVVCVWINITTTSVHTKKVVCTYSNPEVDPKAAVTATEPNFWLSCKPPKIV